LRNEEVKMDGNKLKELIENFRLRNIQVIYLQNLNDAKASILETVPTSCTVGIGHSATLQKIGITQALIERGNIVYDKELAGDSEGRKAIKKKALIADWYITGSNAISVDGKIVNIDHSGNRVAAITFGPDNVIIVVGKNKIVNSLNEAIERAKNIAAPLNAKRAGYNPPCLVMKRCVECTSKERVCNSLSIIEGQSESNRIRILVVDEEIGF
jgi:L-lactate utilization protein LutB